MNKRITIQLAGHLIALCGGGSVHQSFWDGYLAAPSDAEPEITISVSKNCVNGTAVVPGKRSRFVLVHKAISDFLLAKSVLTVHASALLFDGKAYLFCAPSGTGKSTHARLWREAFGERVSMISDDQPLVRIEENCIFACGSPYNGKAKLGANIEAPIGGICVCLRGKENLIERLSPAQATLDLAPTVYIPNEPDPASKALLLIKRLAQNVPVYRHFFNQEPNAAEYAMKRLTGSAGADSALSLELPNA